MLTDIFRKPGFRKPGGASTAPPRSPAPATSASAAQPDSIHDRSGAGDLKRFAKVAVPALMMAVRRASPGMLLFGAAAAGLAMLHPGARQRLQRAARRLPRALQN